MTRQVPATPGSVDDPRVPRFLDEVRANPMFDHSRDVFVARAPGRLDLMGGIADYSGSLVLQWPLQEATLAAVQIVPEATISVLSLEGGGSRRVVVELSSLIGKSLEDVRAILSSDRDSAWAAYVVGVFVVLGREKGIPIPGARVLVRSNVPQGKGVSSSAALEVSVMQAASAALDLSLEPRELALLAQVVENRIVGAACGVMDQMTSSCGKAGHLLALLCQPAEPQGFVALPRDLGVWGLDSGVRHAITGSDYTSVRVAAFMGARILAQRAGFHVEGVAPGRVEIADERWLGFLANVTPSELEDGDLGPLPDSMTGADFLAEYGGTTDAITRVDPDRTYAVRACAAHPVHENFRVRTFAELLGAPATERRSELLGELMLQSHASYSACGLGEEATDLLVDIVREAGSKSGFFGAKITGGGSGGTVAVLGRHDASIDEIARAFGDRAGRQPQIFAGSSAGSAEFGTIRLEPS